MGMQISTHFAKKQLRNLMIFMPYHPRLMHTKLTDQGVLFTEQKPAFLLCVIYKNFFMYKFPLA